MTTEIIPRQLFDDDKPDGYLESDRDFVLNNIAACVAFLETPDPRAARIAELEAALRELASAVIEHQEDNLPSTRQRVRNAIADGMHALNPSIEEER